MAELVKATLTNLAAGPRGLETAAGLMMIEAGAEVSVELDAGELAAVTGTGWFAVTTVEPQRQPKRRPR